MRYPSEKSYETNIQGNTVISYKILIKISENIVTFHSFKHFSFKKFWKYMDL